MEFRRSSFNFTSSRDSAQSANQTLNFTREVRRVAVGIIGYSASFDGNDHHLGRLTVEVNANIQSSDNTKVDVRGEFALRDWSGEFDDNYSGNIQWVVIAELAPLPTPAPGSSRGDLIIIDSEITQAIQHFRSSEHLNAQNVFPDNSIRLVANKPMFIRLYTDYDSSSGLPNISTISGELEVTSGSMTQIIAPISSIPAIRNNNIDRGNLNHTLNFLIPENLCRGTVNLKAKIFNRFDISQFSSDFNKSIFFETFPSLPIIAIGVEYTGDDVNDGATESELTAPTLNDFIDVFEFTEKVYPIPQVVITNYDTIEYDKEIDSDISSGGCDKFGNLLDAIDDFRGDSDDIVYGMVNSGVKTGSVGGCGRSGVVAGRIGAQGTAAHEIGHGLGRKHAPCDNVTRCAEPANTDDNYPNYSGYDSDSIGEYGIDTSNSSLKSPSNSHDFMGYSGNRWVSPYTYKALMSKIPSTFMGASAALASLSYKKSNLIVNDSEWIPIKTPHLFARIDIDSNRNVQFHKSFNFDSRPRQHGNDKTNFSISFIDKDGKVIRNTCLYTDSGCSCCGCDEIKFPVIIRQAIPFPKESKEIVISECEKEIFRMYITEEPIVKIKCKGIEDEKREDITLEWTVSLKEKNESFLSLVQWRDRYGTWRGVAPRTEKTTMQIPKRLFSRQKNIGIRVLVTSGIATGQALWDGDCMYPPSSKPTDVQVDIQLVGVNPNENKSINIPAILKAVPIIDRSKTHLLPEIIWYDESGAEISRGSTIDLSVLPYGESYITASVLETGHGYGINQWLIERTRNNEYRILRGTIERKKPC